MKKLQGMGTSPLVAIGKCIVQKRVEHVFQPEAANISNQELDRFHLARNRAEAELSELIEELKDKSGSNYQIFVAHREMINDVLLKDQVEILIFQGKSAEYAIANACDHFYRLLDKAEDEYLRQRKDDIVDVKERLLGAIKKTQESINITEERVIVVSERIYPSDIMRLLKYGVLGFVSKYGSVYSHSAILARSLNIPYICQAETNYELIREGEILVLDGKSGEVFIDPDPKMIEIFTELVKNQEEQIEASYKTEKIVACTKKGKTIKVMANCNHIYEIDIIAKQDFDGVGLVRSEYLFADHDAYPSEEEQYELYLRFVEKFDPLPVVIRTFDFGADKPNRFLSFDNEDNPALGYRGIRISLREKELFKTQLRALYRASARGNLQIMFPMVTSVEQVTLIKQIIEEVLQELEKLGKDYNEDTEIGLMIETPGAALISDLLADEVDFFSIGTNDLIQYTLAVDRTNANIADLYEADHKAIKRLIKMTCKNAKKAKIRVAMCGEMAEDHALLSRLIDYGVQELSVSPNKINRIKRQICEL